MIQAAFSFRGRNNRRQFATGVMLGLVLMFAIGIAIFIPLCLALVGMEKASVISPELSKSLRALCVSGTVLVAGLPWLWACTALIVRRARNMGINPILFLCLWFGTGLLDRCVLNPMLPPQLIRPLSKFMVLGGGVVSLALLLGLLLIPSNGRPAGGATIRRAAVDPYAGPARVTFGMRTKA